MISTLSCCHTPTQLYVVPRSMPIALQRQSEKYLNRPPHRRLLFARISRSGNSVEWSKDTEQDGKDGLARTEFVKSSVPSCVVHKHVQLGMRDRRVEKRKRAISACSGMTHVIFQSLVLLFILLSCCQHLRDSIIRAQTIVSEWLLPKAQIENLELLQCTLLFRQENPKAQTQMK
jgi:hypothetical protein